MNKYYDETEKLYIYSNSVLLESYMEKIHCFLKKVEIKLSRIHTFKSAMINAFTIMNWFNLQQYSSTT